MNGGGRGVPEWSEVVVLEEGRVSGNSRVVWDIGGKDFKGIRMMGQSIGAGTPSESQGITNPCGGCVQSLE